MDSDDDYAEISELLLSLVSAVSATVSTNSLDLAEENRPEISYFQPISDDVLPCSSNNVNLLTYSDIDAVVSRELANLRVSRQSRGRKRRLRNRERESAVLKFINSGNEDRAQFCSAFIEVRDVIQVNSMLQDSLTEWTRIASHLPETNDELDDYRLAMSMYINSKLLYVNSGLSQTINAQEATLNSTRNHLRILRETVEHIRNDLKAEIEDLRKSTVAAIRRIVECDKGRREKMQAQWEQVQLFVRRKNKRIKELTKQVSCADVDIGFLLTAHKGRIEAVSVAERKYGRAAEKIERLQTELNSKDKYLAEKRCRRCETIINENCEDIKRYCEQDDPLRHCFKSADGSFASTSESKVIGDTVSFEVFSSLKNRFESMEKEIQKLEERASCSERSNDILSRKLLQFKEVELKLKTENNVLKAECAKLRSERDKHLVSNDGACIETPPDSNSSDKSKDDSCEYDVKRVILPKPPAPPKFLATPSTSQRLIDEPEHIDSWRRANNQSENNAVNKPIKRTAVEVPSQKDSKRSKAPKGPAPPLMPPSVPPEMSQGFFGQRRIIRRDLSPPSPQYEPIRNESWQQNNAPQRSTWDDEIDEQMLIRRIHTQPPRCAPPLTPYQNMHLNRPSRPTPTSSWQPPRFVRPRQIAPIRARNNSWWPSGH